MKIIKYKLKMAAGENDVLCEVELPYSQANLETARGEAYNAEVTVEESDCKITPTVGERLAALELALLEMLGVTVDG